MKRALTAIAAALVLVTEARHRDRTDANVDARR